MKNLFSTTKKSTKGTSFYFHEVRTTVQNLSRVLGKPTYVQNDGSDKVNYEWVREFNGNVITIYDWKYYRSVYSDETLKFHIGGVDESITKEAREHLLALIDDSNNILLELLIS